MVNTVNGETVFAIAKDESVDSVVECAIASTVPVFGKRKWNLIKPVGNNSEHILRVVYKGAMPFFAFCNESFLTSHS